MAGFIPYADAEVSGFDNVKSMKMQTSGKAFFVIIAKIYSYKERSMIREICCNAADIHKISGQTKPFDVYLPNELSPVLIVRDYGTGLSEDGMSLFTTVFESSKEGSDSETGYYGLGSKSPFAYTSSFNVLSYLDGTMSMYTVFLDGAKEPKYVKTAEFPTDAPDGLEIQIPVEEDDFRKFEKEARDVLSSFTVPYNLHGAEKEERYHFFNKLTDSSYETNKYHLVHESENAYMLITSRRTNYSSELKSSWFAQLGDVLYPIDRHEIKCTLPEYFGVMKFKPKDLDIPPSRETIEYTPKTQQAIKDKIEAIKKDLSTFFFSDIGYPTSPTEVRVHAKLRAGEENYWCISMKHKSYFANKKYDFTLDSADGFSYYTKVDKESKSHPIWIYDTARAAEIFRQYSTKHYYPACHIVTLYSKKTNKIVFANQEERFKKLKDSLTQNGYTVLLASEMQDDLNLDAPIKRCFMYKLNSDGKFMPVQYGSVTSHPKILMFSSNDTSTERVIIDYMNLKLYPEIADFDIYKIQESKYQATLAKLQTKFKDATFYDVNTFTKFIDDSEIDLSKLTLDEKIYLAAGDILILQKSSVEYFMEMDILVNNTEVQHNLSLIKELSKCDRRSNFYERLSVNKQKLLDNLKTENVNIELIVKICDLVSFLDSYRLVDKNSYTLNSRRYRQCEFNSRIIEQEILSVLTKKENTND